MKYQYTTADYIAAIDRELQKRATTYPKIITTMHNNGAHPYKCALQVSTHALQNQRLGVVLDALISSTCESHGTVGYMELEREYKMRKKVYPRMIYFKRITAETADYELAIWRELCLYFADVFLDCEEMALAGLKLIEKSKPNADPS